MAFRGNSVTKKCIMILP